MLPINSLLPPGLRVYIGHPSNLPFTVTWKPFGEVLILRGIESLLWVYLLLETIGQLILRLFPNTSRNAFSQGECILIFEVCCPGAAISVLFNA